MPRNPDWSNTDELAYRRLLAVLLRRPIETATLIVGVAALIIYGMQTSRMSGQLEEMRRANASSSGSLQQTLDKMQSQTDATNRLQIEAQKQARELQRMSTSALRQVDTAEQFLSSNQSQFKLAERAYLLPLEPQDHGGWGLLAVPIRNYGRVSARKVSFNGFFRINRLDLSSDKPAPLIDKRPLNQDLEIPIVPASVPTFTWQVFLPNFDENEIAWIRSGRDVLHVDGLIKYDAGFGNTDTAQLCFVYQLKSGHWESCTLTESVWLDEVPNSKR